MERETVFDSPKRNKEIAQTKEESKDCVQFDMSKHQSCSACVTFVSGTWPLYESGAKQPEDGDKKGNIDSLPLGQCCPPIVSGCGPNKCVLEVLLNENLILIQILPPRHIDQQNGWSRIALFITSSHCLGWFMMVACFLVLLIFF